MKPLHPAVCFRGWRAGQANVTLWPRRGASSSGSAPQGYGASSSGRDTGLATFLAGETEPRGAHLENLVLTDLVAWRDAQVAPREVLYWRTAAGQEVDFVVEHDGELLPIEVKATARPSHGDAANLRAFREEYGECVRGGLLLHTGTDTSGSRTRCSLRRGGGCCRA